MTAGIDGSLTVSFPKKLRWKWNLCDSEKSEYRVQRVDLHRAGRSETENREAKKKAAAATASSISSGGSRVVMPGMTPGMPGTPRVAGLGQTPRRRLGL